jgi:hypothetical protein
MKLVRAVVLLILVVASFFVDKAALEKLIVDLGRFRPSLIS